MPRENARFSKRVKRVKSYRPTIGVISDRSDRGWRCSQCEEANDRVRQKLNHVLQDPSFEGPEVTHCDEVARGNHQREEQHQAEKGEDPDPDGGPAFGRESLVDGVESGASSLLVIEDGEPLCGARFFFVGESNFVELPFIMFNHIIELERNIGDDEMIGQLESARRRDVKAIWPWLQEDF